MTSFQDTDRCLPPTEGSPADATRLRNAFVHDFAIGTILSRIALQERASDDAALTETALATRHFSALTAENSMKPEALQPAEGRFTFDEADRLVEIAERCEAVPVGHTLVWHAQTPAWFFTGPDGGPAGRELALARMRTHIATVVGRYKGRIRQWDVVNEALSDAPGEWLRPSPWRDAIGDDFIAEAFRAAHAADPAALLIYNDYNIELPDKRDKALRLLRSLLDQDVPIHAVGIQAHWRRETFDLAKAETAITQFAALGLTIMITEMDIGVLPADREGADIAASKSMTSQQRSVMDPYPAGLPEEVARQQAEQYRQAFALFLRHRDVIGRVSFWGTYDGASWLNNFPVRGRTDYPLLFDRSGRPKPAFHAVLRAAEAAN
jgi:endo-1,4-beta-xylanase